MSTATMDFMKIEKCTSDSGDESSISDGNKNAAISCDGKGRLKLSKKLSHESSVGLFARYLFPKAQLHVGKTNEEESDTIRRRAPSGPLVPPKFGDTSRHPSFLEQELLAGIKQDEKLPSSSGEKSSTAQLTIFYSGAINVYDNVSIDKAQAIMLLAGGNSLSTPIVTNLPKLEAPKLQISNLPSICKLQAELPIARKRSLQRFLEKRRDRNTNKSPYGTPTSTQHDDKDDKPCSHLHLSCIS